FDVPLASIERDPGPGGAVRVTISGHREFVPPVSITVDSRTVARGGTAEGGFVGAQALGIATAFARGTRATITMAGATTPLSLKGAAAALRYIDDRQQRAGTMGALVARGSAPDVSAPRPTLPVVRLVQTAEAPATLSPSLIASMRKTAECEPIAVPSMAQVEAYALGGGRTLAIVPCGLGAYQSWSAIYVVTGGRAVPALFDVTIYDVAEPVPVLTSAGFERGILTSYAKGRGLGDCGIGQTFVWDGERFRLTERDEMPQCRGSTELIPTWRARVVAP
ncbi:MAG TPA: DUF1176 domain-containing protein, partial [Sphingomonas sp.]